jgi:hypothetical protein
LEPEFTLLLEAILVAASFGVLWLSFRLGDRRRQFRETREETGRLIPHRSQGVSDFKISKVKKAPATEAVAPPMAARKMRFHLLRSSCGR